MTGVGVEYRILGPVEVRVDGQSLDLGPKKQRSLFALLLINRNRTVSTDRILDALWGGDAQGKENALWVYISRLRSILAEVTSESVLVTRDHGYRLDIGPDELDAAEFEGLTDEGTGALDRDPDRASELLARALGMWRGNALEDFTYEDFAQPEIARLTELRRSASDARFEADLMCGKAGELIGELEQHADTRPYDETPTRQLMLALYRSGRQTAALRTFERFRKRLGEDTGTDPSPELRRLEEQILFHDSHLARVITDETAVDAPNPYKGLEAFREEDAHLFFGRDPLVAELLGTIDGHSIVTVVGPSGCGKSSVVRSGVLPAIRKAALQDSDRWLIAPMTPGTHPFIELEAALLRSELDAPDSLKSQLEGSPDEILRAALRVAPREDTTVLILVDQFEELFTVCDPATADRFLTGIVEAASDSRKRVRFVLTLRADFYDRPLAHAGFGRAMSGGIVNVVPMAPEELEEAAAGPAQRVGVRLESGLEAALVGDVLGQPGALPLFEFALTDLFDRRVGDTLTLDAYRTMGGIQGAVSRKAEHLYDRLTPSQQAAAQQVFLRLVSISDGETRSRRRVEASELLSLELDVADLQAVLDVFGKDRLLSFDRSDVTGSPTVEVAHEALLEHWDRLAAWVTAAEQDVKQNARLTALASEWEDHGEDDAYLLSEGRYQDYAVWASSATLTLARPQREYLERSRQVYADRERDEAERVERERVTSRRARRNAWSLAALIAVVVIAGVYLAWALTRPEGPTIAFTHTSEDDSFERTMLDGLTRAGESYDFVGQDYLLTTDPAQQLRDIAETGPLAILATSVMAGVVDEVAPDYPDVAFVIIDGGSWADVPNVYGIGFDNGSGAYLAGATAALATETGRVAFIAPGQFGDASWAAELFIAGARSAADVEVEIGWISAGMIPNDEPRYLWEGFARPDLADALATELYTDGVDVIYGWAGPATAGVIEAADRYTDVMGRQVWAIAPDDDWQLKMPDHADSILVSMIKRFDEAVIAAVGALLADESMQDVLLDLYPRGAGQFSGIASDITTIAVDLEVEDVELEHWATVPYRWPEAPASVRQVIMTVGECGLRDVSDVPAGRPISFVVRNTTPDGFDAGLYIVSSTVTQEELAAMLFDEAVFWDLLVQGLIFPTYGIEVPPGGEVELRGEFLGESFGMGLGAIQCGDGDLTSSIVGFSVDEEG